MKKQIWLALVCAALTQPFVSYADTITAGAPNASYMTGPGAANWVQDETGWWYRYPDGTYPANQWQQVQNRWYYFDDKGYMMTGLVLVEGAWYYLAEDGAMVTDQTMEIGGITYEFGADGAADVISPYKQPTYIPPESEKTELMKTNDAMADQILARIINDSMSERQKAEAIYHWVRGNMSYSAAGTVGDWPQAAYEGMRRKRGNCYTYYATSLELLSRAGIPSIEVVRSRDNDHWWNLVYVDGAWYHFDTTPRRQGGNFCLLTTAQLLAYSNSHGHSHMFDQSLYPPTP